MEQQRLSLQAHTLLLHGAILHTKGAPFLAGGYGFSLGLKASHIEPTVALGALGATPESLFDHLHIAMQVLEEEAAMAASAAMAETVMQSLGQALTQPAPHSARAGLQVTHASAQVLPT